MKRRTTVPTVLPSHDGAQPAYRWLYATLRTAILEGSLRAGTRLPATRDLAEQYGLSRGTVVAAFDQLKAEGYIDARSGSGSFVSAALPDAPFRKAKPVATRSAKRRTLSRFGARLQPFPTYAPIATRSFRPNVPAIDLFPKELWAKSVARRLRTGDDRLLLGCEAQGYRPLREAVASYLTASRGVRADADRIIIVSGVQEALDIAARVLIDAGDRACIEQPGYDGARFVLEAAGAEVVPLPIDREGMELREEAMRGAKLAYTTPAHQYPLGVTMSIARRLALLAWAHESGAVIFEDDYDSEFRFRAKPLQALQGVDTHGSVIFAGSFSKVMFPSLRLGYVVVPPDLVDAFAAVKSVTSRHAPLVDQAALCDFIADGHFGRHLRRMREIYAERFDALTDAFRRHLDGAIEVTPIEAGLQTLAWLHAKVRPERLIDAAAKRDVDLRTIPDAPRTALLLGFAAVDVPEIERGAKQLAAALSS